MNKTGIAIAKYSIGLVKVTPCEIIKMNIAITIANVSHNGKIICLIIYPEIKTFQRYNNSRN